MKLSTKIILPIILISALLILLAGCFGVPADESPGYTPGTITGIIASPCCSTSAEAVDETSGSPEYWCYYCQVTWDLQDGIEVVLTYGEDEVATTTTNDKGEFTFTNVSPGKNYVVTAYCPDFNDNRPLVKDVALELIEGGSFDTKITDLVSTSLGLVVDFLVLYTEWGPEDISLDEVLADRANFPNFPKFKKLVYEVRRVVENCEVNLLTDDDVQDALCRAAEEISKLTIGCGPGYTPPPPPPPTLTYTVTFDSQGGSAVNSQTVAHGGKATEPTDLTKTGYTFAGWYKESGCTNAWDFDIDTVTADVTLYAKWTINSYTVTFDKNGGDTEANPMTKPATHGGNVGTLPEAPTRTGYTFASWNTQADGSGSEFTAATVVIADITVYAKWTINSYTVTFNSQGGSTVDPQTVEPGGKVTKPADPIWAGYAFGGWYKESGCTTPWNFDTDTVTSDVTLYAKWTGSIDRYVSTSGNNGNDGSAANRWLTIQHALDNTPDGGTIHVANGTYTENISFPSAKVIVLKSESGRDVTIIEGDGTDSVVNITYCLDGTTLDGFTITGGDASYFGGGIHIYYSSSPIIQNNNITGNTGYCSGGIDITDSSATIQNNNITGNTGSYGSGGIFINLGSPTIQNNNITGNISNGGSGIYITNSSATIQNNIITGNTASKYSGGGIFINNSTSTIEDNTISGNISEGSNGGGISIKGGSPTIQNNNITGNTASNYGGGIDISGMATIQNNIISGNTATTYSGGGIYIYSSSPIIQNNIISGNTASDCGGGIYIYGGSPTIGGETSDFNTICGNTPLPQINPDDYPNNYISDYCIGGTGPAGGWIFYDDEADGVDDIAGARYLEVAPSDQSGPYHAWSNIIDVEIGTSAQGTAIGTGQTNTTAIITQDGHTASAAQLCDILTEGGYSDWFLPSQDELNLMYTNLHNIVPPVGGFADSQYWSSSEYDANFARYQNFANDFQAHYNKSTNLRVRAVRAF